ncbi:SDR family NAD(P)-dependent oxidoreductase [Hamadaea tsunoensis]|uniref:SDR family NAD(P)-dependent oxidoreductase n=1 Tax=Hamadaea tsunoensis TaxID=53368 RepID=UPI00146FBB5E|nr:SDR family NAD(P)-dependent oxidoreductase [Hamadaea tsunoensis]
MHVVITGTSRGLGAALADQVLGEPGARVLALARGFTAEQEADPRLTPYACDLAELGSLPGRAALAGFLAGAREAALVLNAAVVEPIGPAVRLDPAAVERAVAVNLTSAVLLTGAVLAARPDGVPLKIVFVSTGAAHHVIDGWSVYSATKRGAEEFFAHVAAEWAHDPGVTVSVVNPGVLDTGMQEIIRGADFAERDRFIRRHAEGELRPPAHVAKEIFDEYLAV